MGLFLLLYYEWQYVNYLKKKISAQTFCSTFRISDDLIIISEYFEKRICNIYPAELELKKKNKNKLIKTLYF